MRRTWLVGFAGAVAIALAVGGVASSAPSVNPPGVDVSSGTQAEGVSPAAFTAANLAHDNSYKVINPCRIVDTRISGGGILKVNATQTFQASGTTGFAPQGGKSGGCGIPAGAVAVTASVVSTGSQASGRLRLWGADQSEPSILSMIFLKGQEIAQSLTYSISDTGKFKAKAMFGATHITVDVTGYYLPPLFAVVTDNGTLYQSSGLTLSSHTSTGYYILQAPRTITQCAVTVSSFGTYQAGAFASAQYIYVNVSQANGTAVNAYFQAVVTC